MDTDYDVIVAGGGLLELLQPKLFHIILIKIYPFFQLIEIQKHYLEENQILVGRVVMHVQRKRLIS